MRISVDTKAAVRIGPFSRGGKNRITTKASDHDFQGETVTPLGIFLPKYDDLSLWFTKSKTTSDFIVDSLEMWWNDNCKRFSKVTNLGTWHELILLFRPYKLACFSILIFETAKIA